MSTIIYKQTAGSQQTQSGNWTPITGLAFQLPPQSTPELTNALIILNVPNPYATGNDFPGAMFGITVNNAVLLPFACFTAESQTPQSWGRRPTTLVVQVKLTTDPQDIQAVWQSVRSSTIIIDTPATLSAIISRD